MQSANSHLQCAITFLDSMANTNRAENARFLASLAEFHASIAELTGDDQMPMQQLQLLLNLYVHGQLNQQSLEDHTKVSKSANSRNIQKLGSGEWATSTDGTKKFKPGLGLVESYREPTNLRISIVQLTAKGKAVLDAAASRANSKYLEA